MRAPVGNYTFTYTQRARSNADGEFSMVLPYSTAGYAEYGPENGYTNVSVRAVGPYNISTPSTLVQLNESAGVEEYAATVDVPEGQVNGDQSGTVEVTLERRTSELTLGDTDGESQIDTASTAPDDDASSADRSTDATADLAVGQSLDDPTGTADYRARVN
jgi:dolichyl-diphosphooligosaccharide--protein glycosyltransferase